MFEMRDAIVRQMIFAMENQNVRYLMDMRRGVLVRPDTIPEEERPGESEVMDPEDRYQPIPQWTSADGFQLMEHFLGELHNPVIRDRLQEILVSGKRVFRRFKDAVKEHPEVEKRFYTFKFLEMRRYVFEWYNQLRELSGLEIQELGADEELDDLVLTNVSIEEVQHVPATVITELDRQAFFEAYQAEPEAVTRYLYRRRTARLPSPGDARSTLVAAYTPMEDLCGFVWSTTDTMDDGTRLDILNQVYVLPEYRGLGIGSYLVDRTVAVLKGYGSQTILVHLPGTSEPIYGLLERIGFRGVRRDFLLNLGEEG